MPLTVKFNLGEDIPSGLSTDIELVNKTVMIDPFKIIFSAGVFSTNAIFNNCSLNFGKSSIDSLKVESTTYTFVSERVEDIPGFGTALAKYLTKKGFEDVTFSMGNITKVLDGTLCISAFQLQDAHALGSGKYVYTRINCSKDIDLNNFKGYLDFCSEAYGKATAITVAVVVGIIVAALIVSNAVPAALWATYGGVITAIIPVLEAAV